MKTSARQTAVDGEVLPPGKGESGAVPKEVQTIDLTRRRLDDAIASLEQEVTARVAQVRAESGTKVTALETEVARLKSEKRELERACAELRKAAEVAGGRIDQAMTQVRALLGEGADSA